MYRGKRWGAGVGGLWLSGCPCPGAYEALGRCSPSSAACVKENRWFGVCFKCLLSLPPAGGTGRAPGGKPRDVAGPGVRPGTPRVFICRRQWLRRRSSVPDCSSPALCAVTPYLPVRPPTLWGDSLPCDLNSLKDLRRDVDFSVCSAFAFLIARMRRTTPRLYESEQKLHVSRTDFQIKS